MLPATFVTDIEQIVGAAFVKRDEAARTAYGQDGLKQPHLPEIVALPGSTSEVAAMAETCHAQRVPLYVRGGGTGYSGGAVPLLGGVLMSMERFNRILEIDEQNLLVVTEPNVITGRLQAEVEKVGLFYPPDPASLDESVIGGNIAECAGGPRAFKYGTTKRYVLGLEAVLPTGEIIRTGSKAVKNVVGYDLTQLLVGSEGTLAIITQAVLRLIPKPPAHATIRATFDSIDAAVEAVNELIRARVVPATIELVDGECLAAVTRYLGGAALAPAGTSGLLILEVDGMARAVEEEAHLVEAACRAAGATELLRAATEEERQELWRVRRELSPALKTIASMKINQDVVVPRGRMPDLFQLIGQLRREFNLTIPCFGHAGDGNIHVNIMVDGSDADAVDRAHRAQRRLFEGVVAREGSISGEHGIGFTKAPFLSIELSPEVIALSRRIKQAFDPHGILNPGKIFPSTSDAVVGAAGLSGRRPVSSRYTGFMPLTVAVIGASSDRKKFGNKALRAFRDRGYTVIPINPKEAEVEGEKSYASVLDVPGAIDMATFYVSPAVGLTLLDDLAKKGITDVWFNPGADSPELVARAKALELKPVVACSILGIGASPTAY